jgi:hypothetical protein
VYFGAGTLTAGDVYSLRDSGGTPTWVSADANGASYTYQNLLAIAIGTSASDGMLLRGFYRNSSKFGLIGTIGAPVYLSNTAGALSNSAPTGTTNVRIVGYMIDDTNFVLYFNPDNTWVGI